MQRVRSFPPWPPTDNTTLLFADPLPKSTSRAQVFAAVGLTHPSIVKPLVAPNIVKPDGALTYWLVPLRVTDPADDPNNAPGVESRVGLFW